jgi:hypothetical protein
MDLVKAIKAIEKGLAAAQRDVNRTYKAYEAADKRTKLHKFLHGRNLDAPPMFLDERAFVFAQVAPHLHDYTFQGHHGLDAVFAWASAQPYVHPAGWGSGTTPHAENEYEVVQQIWASAREEYPNDPWPGQQEYGWNQQEGIAAFLIFRGVHNTKAAGREPPKRRVRGLGALDANTLEQWNGKRFRMPDAFDGNSAVWYGPGGADGEHATVATFDGDDVIVWEYTYVVGLIEDPYADYAVTKTHLACADIEAALPAGGGGFTSNLQVLRWAAALGVAKLAYHGGEESWANKLPR